MCKNYVICKRGVVEHKDALEDIGFIVENSKHAKHLCPVLNSFRIHIARHIFKPGSANLDLDWVHVHAGWAADDGNTLFLNKVVEAFNWWHTDRDSEFPKGMCYGARCFVIFSIMAWCHVRERRRTDVGSF
jgi:hypothetical protein